MKPVRRKIRRHFGLTANQLTVRSQRPWYFQWAMSALILLLGFILAYLFFNGGVNGDIHKKMELMVLENLTLQTKLMSIERELQIKQGVQDNLAKELASVQDEGMKTKENLIFYKNMLSNKGHK